MNLRFVWGYAADVKERAKMPPKKRKGQEQEQKDQGHTGQEQGRSDRSLTLACMICASFPFLSMVTRVSPILTALKEGAIIVKIFTWYLL